MNGYFDFSFNSSRESCLAWRLYEQEDKTLNQKVSTIVGLGKLELPTMREKCQLFLKDQPFIFPFAPDLPDRISLETID